MLFVLLDRLYLKDYYNFMKKGKTLRFDDVMDIYEGLFPGRKAVRVDPALKAVTPKTVSERIRETIKLSEQLIWKRPSKR